MANEWTPQRISKLPHDQILTLRENAKTRMRNDVVDMCDRVIGAFSTAKEGLSRSAVFDMHGFVLTNSRWSWGGTRPRDGAIALTMWNNDIERGPDGHCTYHLAEPDLDGTRPWADSAGGKERLRHCQEVVAAGGKAFGIVIHGLQPENEPAIVQFADPELIPIEVEKKGEAYWALWREGRAEHERRELLASTVSQ